VEQGKKREGRGGRGREGKGREYDEKGRGWKGKGSRQGTPTDIDWLRHWHLVAYIALHRKPVSKLKSVTCHIPRKYRIAKCKIRPTCHLPEMNAMGGARNRKLGGGGQRGQERGTLSYILCVGQILIFIQLLCASK